jgi:hypothetical protein
MKEVPLLFNARKKSNENLVELYVTVIREKARYQYDPKKLIFSLFPDKKKLYTVFMPKKEFSLGQSKREYGNLEMSEHRFINFLMFTFFTEDEMTTIFEQHVRILKADEPPAPYQYSSKELYTFINNLTPSTGSNEEQRSSYVLTPEGRIQGITELTEEEIEKLYSKEEAD